MEQNMKALERANLVRIARAELKREVLRGERDVATVVRECPWETETMTIFELLTAQRRWGRARARRFLTRLGTPLPENKALGSLTDRQRRKLAAALDEVGARPPESVAA